jgi:hypothetical protein
LQFRISADQVVIHIQTSTSSNPTPHRDILSTCDDLIKQHLPHRILQIMAIIKGFEVDKSPCLMAEIGNLKTV